MPLEGVKSIISQIAAGKIAEQRTQTEREFIKQTPQYQQQLSTLKSMQARNARENKVEELLLSDPDTASDFGKMSSLNAYVEGGVRGATMQSFMVELAKKRMGETGESMPEALQVVSASGETAVKEEQAKRLAEAVAPTKTALAYTEGDIKSTLGEEAGKRQFKLQTTLEAMRQRGREKLARMQTDASKFMASIESGETVEPPTKDMMAGLHENIVGWLEKNMDKLPVAIQEESWPFQGIFSNNDPEGFIANVLAEPVEKIKKMGIPNDLLQQILTYKKYIEGWDNSSKVTKRTVTQLDYDKALKTLEDVYTPEEAIKYLFDKGVMVENP